MQIVALKQIFFKYQNHMSPATCLTLPTFLTMLVKTLEASKGYEAKAEEDIWK